MYYNSSQNNYDMMFGSPIPNMPVFGSFYLGLQSYSPGVIARDGSGNKDVIGAQAYGFHGGIQSVHQITTNTSAFYDVSYGTLDFDAKLGVAYSFTPNVDLNLSFEYNNLRLNQFGLNIANCNTVESWIPALTATLKF
ncbi:MAG: hypothetical protein WCV63_05365 [Negativicutes bacterium]|jgi:hypothetical protein